MSLFCDGMYREIGGYDFVGNMDRNFYNDLSALGEKFGGNMSASLEEVFNVTENMKKNVRNTGKETRSPDHVKEYYSGKTIRRVLRYLSIDYVKLNLKVPEWAQEILEEEALGTET